MPEGEIQDYNIESRRTVVDKYDFRFKMHLRKWNYFPEQEIFENSDELHEELKDREYKGLREDACRYSMLKTVGWLNDSLEAHKDLLSDAVTIQRNEISENFKDIYKRDDFSKQCINIDEIDASLLREIFSASNNGFELGKLKGWGEYNTSRFIAKVGMNILKSDLLVSGSKLIPLSILRRFLVRIEDQTLAVLEDRKKVATDFLLDQFAIDLENSHKLEVVYDSSIQTESDKEEIESVKKKPRKEQIKKTLSTVSENTQYIRTDLIPHLVKAGTDSKTVFWNIHAGEFKGDPVAAQMLTAGEIASMFNYVESAGKDFYEKSIGKVRRNNVNSGGFDHVLPRYLPYLQDDFFERIDTLREEVNEDEFLDIETIADIAMISLHLPFDGAGRTKEDFFVYLSQKYNFPLTFSVLGFRDIGSPLMIYRNDAIRSVKREINKCILKRLGIDSETVTDKGALNLVMERFDCDSEMATKVFQSEKALITSQMVDAIGDREKTALFASELPSFKRLKQQWKYSRKLRFLKVSDEYHDQVVRVASEISYVKDLRYLESSLVEKGKYVANFLKNAGIEVELFQKLSKLNSLLNDVDILNNQVMENILVSSKELGNDEFSTDVKLVLDDLVNKVREVIYLREEYRQIVKELDSFKAVGNQELTDVAKILEIKALGKMPVNPDRNIVALLSEVFPELGNLPPDI